MNVYMTVILILYHARRYYNINNITVTYSTNQSGFTKFLHLSVVNACRPEAAVEM